MAAKETIEKLEHELRAYKRLIEKMREELQVCNNASKPERFAYFTGAMESLLSKTAFECCLDITRSETKEWYITRARRKWDKRLRKIVFFLYNNGNFGPDKTRRLLMTEKEADQALIDVEQNGDTQTYKYSMVRVLR
jgi:hypothetical protein